MTADACINGVSGITCMILCFIAAVTDSLWRRIPNLVTFPGILIGAVLTLISASEPLLKLLVFVLLFLFGPVLFGEGDVKLSMMSVMLSGVRAFIYSFLISQFLILFLSLLISPSRTVKAITVLIPCNGKKQMPQYSSGIQAYPFAPAFFVSIALVLSWRWFGWNI